MTHKAIHNFTYFYIFLMHHIQTRNPGSAGAEGYDVEQLPHGLTPVKDRGQQGAGTRKVADSEIQIYKQQIADLKKELQKLKLKGINDRNLAARCVQKRLVWSFFLSEVEVIFLNLHIDYKAQKNEWTHKLTFTRYKDKIIPAM